MYLHWCSSVKRLNLGLYKFIVEINFVYAKKLAWLLYGSYCQDQVKFLRITGLWSPLNRIQI